MRWFERVVLGFWWLEALSVLALWSVTLATGPAWSRGLFAYQNGNVPVFHLIAEIVMAAVVIAGLVFWHLGKGWSGLLLLAGAGMFGYSSINSAGWALNNQPALLVPMALCWLGLPALFVLLARTQPPFRQTFRAGPFEVSLTAKGNDVGLGLRSAHR